MSAVTDFEVELIDMGFWPWFIKNAPESMERKFSKYFNLMIEEEAKYGRAPYAPDTADAP
jgi:hypothetical protein